MRSLFTQRHTATVTWLTVTVAMWCSLSKNAGWSSKIILVLLLIANLKISVSYWVEFNVPITWTILPHRLRKHYMATVTRRPKVTRFSTHGMSLLRFPVASSMQLRRIIWRPWHIYNLAKIFNVRITLTNCMVWIRFQHFVHWIKCGHILRIDCDKNLKLFYSEAKKALRFECFGLS